jgi:hypothetical protein
MDRDIAAMMPASKTFQASREDILSNLAFFLGDPVSPEKLKARGRYAFVDRADSQFTPASCKFTYTFVRSQDYSESHAATYHFPDAFYGQNT